MFTSSCRIYAQESTNSVLLSKQIINIKRTNEYFWAEASAMSVQEAFDVANISLVQHVSNYILDSNTSKKTDFDLLKNKAAKCESIEIQRGDMYRVFVYIKKTDILQTNYIETLENERLKTDVTTVERKQKSDSTSVNNDSTSNLSRSDNPENLKEWQMKLINDLVVCESLHDIVLYLQKNMATGKITRMGTNNDNVRNADKTFFITYDDSDKVTALYGRIVNNKRFNYVDFSEYSTDKYRNSKYLWFTIIN